MNKKEFRFYVSKVSIYVFIFCGLFLIQRFIVVNFFDVKKFIIFGKIFEKCKIEEPPAVVTTGGVLCIYYVLASFCLGRTVYL